MKNLASNKTRDCMLPRLAANTSMHCMQFYLDQTYFNRFPNFLAFLLWIVFLFSPATIKAENDNQLLTGTINLSHSSAYASHDDFGYENEDQRIPSQSLQSLRLIAEGVYKNHIEYDVQFLSVNSHSNRTLSAANTANIYRIKSLREYTINETSDNETSLWYQELDRASIKVEYENYRFSAGRQPISWGTGRFWQPLDVFGAFNATELDRDYKPGIDLLTVDYFLNDFSSLSLVYVFSPWNTNEVYDSQAMFYQRQFGLSSNFSFLLGNIQDNKTIGTAVETDWHGAGLRFEASVFETPEFDSLKTFWITGLDYQFSNDIFFSLEYYYHSAGTNDSENVEAVMDRKLYLSGLQKHISRHLLGLTLQKNVTPLLNMNYFLLAANMDNKISMLHQITGILSVSNESDLWLTLLLGTGEGINDQDAMQSEFGHIPVGASIKFRMYF